LQELNNRLLLRKISTDHILFLLHHNFGYEETRCTSKATKIPIEQAETQVKLFVHWPGLLLRAVGL